MKYSIGAAATAIALVLSATAGQALTWTISGPGATSVDVLSATESRANYNLDGVLPGDETWLVSAIADQTGTYSIDWAFSGFHSWFQAEAGLAALNPGTHLVTPIATTSGNYAAASVSGGFNFSGSDVLFNVVAGDTIAFRISGSHFDSSQLLRGSLTLDVTAPAVPVPAGLPLLLTGVGALVLSRRKS